MKRIPREMKICLWQNVLKCGEWYHEMFQIRKKCRVEMYEMLEHNIKIEKEKRKILYFSS